jgi:hypothetical protein
VKFMVYSFFDISCFTEVVVNGGTSVIRVHGWFSFHVELVNFECAEIIASGSPRTNLSDCAVRG